MLALVAGHEAARRPSAVRRNLRNEQRLPRSAGRCPRLLKDSPPGTIDGEKGLELKLELKVLRRFRMA